MLKFIQKWLHNNFLKKKMVLVGFFLPFPNIFDRWLFSRVKIIGNERPGASPCDPRGRVHANNTKSIVLYNIRLHIPCSYFMFSLGLFHFLFHAEAANRKQTVNIATRGNGYTYVIGLHKSNDVLFHKMLSSSY